MTDLNVNGTIDGITEIVRDRKVTFLDMSVRIECGTYHASRMSEVSRGFFRTG